MRPPRWSAVAIAEGVALARRRPRHVLLAAAVAGMLTRDAPVSVSAAATSLALWLAWRSRGLDAVVVIGVAASLLLGAAVADIRLAALDRTALRPWIGHAATLRVILLEQPRQRSYGREAALAVVRAGPGRGERVLVRASRLDAGIGHELRVRGGFRALPPFERAASRRGAHALVDADVAAPTGARRGGLAGALDRVRERADRGLEQGLPAPLGSLARGIVLGEGSALPASLSEDFQTVGLTHVVAASGANVALLAALALALGAALGAPLRLRLWSALVAVAAYVPLAGGGPSVQRAGVMGVATIVATLASSRASRWYALLSAAAATLVVNPRVAGDPGWQMSFAAVIALIALAPAIRRRLASRMPHVVAELAAVTTAATVATAPLIALHFDRVSLLSLPVNVAAAPAVPVAMWLGALAALVAQLSPVCAAPLMALCAWPLAFLVALAQAAASLPGAEVAAPQPSLVAVAGVVAVAALTMGRRLRSGCRPLGVLAIAVVAGAVLVATRLPEQTDPPPGLVVSALDVGQGDATLIQHDGHAILVDAGPPDGGVVRRLEAAGVRRVDLLVVTHAQSDHEGGAAAVLDALPVGLVLDGRDGVRSADGARFAAVAARRRVRVVAGSAGQLLRVGPMTLDVLSPQADPRSAHAGEDPNLRAIVAELRDGGFSMLLTADAESDVLSTLQVGPVDVLKVSHHGSADEGLPSLLARLRPRLALISVGRGNRYGHPAPATLAALDAVATVLRTDRDGTVRLQVGPDGIAVDRHT